MAVSHDGVEIELRKDESDKLSIKLTGDGDLELLLEDERYKSIRFSFEEFEAMRSAVNKLWEVKGFLEKI